MATRTSATGATRRGVGGIVVGMMTMTTVATEMTTGRSAAAAAMRMTRTKRNAAPRPSSTGPTTRTTTRLPRTIDGGRSATMIRSLPLLAPGR